MELPENKYVIWYSKGDPEWYIRDPDGALHAATRVDFWGEGTTMYNPQGFPLPNGPKAVIVVDTAIWPVK